MDLRPLRHRDFRSLYIAQFVSFLGTMVTYVALPYQMYKLTGSSLNVGLLGLAELLPLLVTAFVGGALADSVDRRRMILMTEVGLGLGSATLALMAFAGKPPVWALYAVSAVMSGLNGLQRPSLDALVPRLVNPDEMTAMASLAMLRGSIGMIAGPALGGALLASTGLGVTYLFDVLTYAFSFFAIRTIRTVLPPESAESPSLRSVLDGFRYARSRQELIGTYVVDFVAMVFGMPLALFPALSDRLGGPSVLGLLYAAPAAGALVAAAPPAGADVAAAPPPPDGATAPPHAASSATPPPNARPLRNLRRLIELCPMVVSFASLANRSTMKPYMRGRTIRALGDQFRHECGGASLVAMSIRVRIATTDFPRQVAVRRRMEQCAPPAELLWD